MHFSLGFLRLHAVHPRSLPTYPCGSAPPLRRDRARGPAPGPAAGSHVVARATGCRPAAPLRPKLPTTVSFRRKWLRLAVLVGPVESGRAPSLERAAAVPHRASVPQLLSQARGAAADGLGSAATPASHRSTEPLPWVLLHRSPSPGDAGRPGPRREQSCSRATAVGPLGPNGLTRDPHARPFDNFSMPGL